MGSAGRNEGGGREPVLLPSSSPSLLALLVGEDVSVAELDSCSLLDEDDLGDSGCLIVSGSVGSSGVCGLARGVALSPETEGLLRTD